MNLFFKKFSLSIAIVMMAGCSLCAQGQGAKDPLYIDSEGNVYIRVKEGNKKFRVEGYTEFVDSIQAAVLQANVLRAGTQLVAKQLFVSGMSTLSDSVKITGRLSVEGNSSTLGNAYVKGTSFLNGNLMLGNSTNQASLEFVAAVKQRKISLWSVTTNENEFYGFGISGGTLRYQVDGEGANHVFYAGKGANESRELMRIKGNGKVGIGTDNPNATLEVKGDVKGTTINGEKAPYVLAINSLSETRQWHTGKIPGDIVKNYLEDADGGTIKIIARQLNGDHLKIAVIHVYIADVQRKAALYCEFPNGGAEMFFLNKDARQFFDPGWPTMHSRITNSYEMSFELENGYVAEVILYDR